MNVFIVRPFETKNGIDFDTVEADLIKPALTNVGIAGSITAEIALLHPTAVGG